PVHHGQDRRAAAARLHPVLDREAAVHGARGHVHDAPRRAVEIYRRYQLRLAPGATVVKNTVVTTKPAAVPVIRVPREVPRPGPGVRPAAGAVKPDRSAPSAPDWGQPMEIPPASAYRHVVIAYGSNFGAS